MRDFTVCFGYGEKFVILGVLFQHQMRILYDHQAFTGSQYGGVSRYFFELIQYLSRQSTVETEVAAVFSNNEYLQKLDITKPFSYRALATNTHANKAFSMLNRLVSNSKISAGNYDVFHPTYFHEYFLKPLKNKPFVLTFHDASSEIMGEKYPEIGQYLPALKAKLLARAAAVIAVSEHTRRDIIRFFPDINPEKIKVVHLGSSMSQTPLLKPTQSLPERYLLYVGKRDFYKNFSGMWQGVRDILVQDTALSLVCAGGGAFTDAELAVFEATGLEKRVRHVRFGADAELANLYANAQVFIFPSFNEGFGFTALEALQCGCACALANNSSLPEVGGEAAVYFDPTSPDNIRDAVASVLYDDSLRAKMVRQGYEQANKFSVRKNALETLDVYKSVI